MDRRDVLKSGVLLGSVGLAGCFDVFETQSAWRDPPLVEDRPDDVYIPASTEEMGIYGIGEAGEYTAALSYTFPHRFWTITGTETNMADIGDEDALHLMASVWETETDTVVPADLHLTVEGEGTTPYAGQLWPMLSQRMGFHYGDNLSMDEDGEYVATLRINPADARGVGEFEELFEEPRSVAFEFAFETDDVYDLEFELIDEERRGQRGELPLMDHEEMGHANHDDHDDHGDHDHDHDDHDDHDDRPHMPHPTVPPAEEFPGEVVGTEESGGAAFVVASLDEERFGGPYLAVSPRTPQNRTMLPLMALSVSIDRDGEPLGDASLEATLDAELGFHYGTTVELEAGDAIRVDVESVPQISRHDGYETAFMEMPSIELSY